MDIKSLFILKSETIKSAAKLLDETGKKILLVVDEDRLLGVITDGDIRRWILKNGSLDDSVSNIMSVNPIVLLEHEIHLADKVMKENLIEAIPILSFNKEVVNMVFLNDAIKSQIRKNKLEIPLVIMAGGQGTRLYPYTHVLPKPLIPVGDLPIVERIINSFVEYGASLFYMTVNYKKNMIKAYFNELNRNYELKFIDEDKPLGTAGSLSLLKNEIKTTFFLSNCDILVDIDYSSLLKHHNESKNQITIVASLKNYKIPYGILEMNSNSIVNNILEKPEYDFLVNTGMYVVEPSVLFDIPDDEFSNMTDVIRKYINQEKKIGVYPISEGSWMDMGQLEELDTMIEKMRLK